MFDRIIVTLTTNGIGLNDVMRMDCTRAVRLANASLEQKAADLEVNMLLAASPAEMMFSKEKLGIKRLWSLYERYMDLQDVQPRKKTLRDYFTDQEWEEIQKIEAEMAEANPWVADPDRLDKVYAAHGTLKLHQPKGDGLDVLRGIGVAV